MIHKITITHKIYTLAIIGVVVALGIAGGSIYSINTIGKKLKQIAEEDIPLTAAVTNITVHQLEQAIFFERASRYAEVMYYKRNEVSSNNSSIKKHYDGAKKSFLKYAKKVDTEILTAEKQVADIIEHEKSHGGSDKVISEFSHVETVLKKVGKEHHSFNKHVEQAFSLYESGNIYAAEKLAQEIEKEEDNLTHELDALLVELEKFTAEAALSAEHLEEQAFMILLIASASAALLSALLSFVIVRSIIKPLLATKDFAQKLSSGDLEAAEPVHKFKDEIAGMLAALAVFKENAVETNRLRAQQEEMKIENERQQKEAMLAMANDFESGVGGMISSLASASTELQSTAESMKNVSDQTSQASQAVSASSEESSVSVNTVASAMEEMSASSTEIASQVAMTSTRSTDTATNAKTANETVDKLDTLVQNIGQVVESIQDIAEQTNLLALNATIEAARAGDAGKGFAVVADEVKKLASETSQKTEEISTQINEIQSATSDSVEAMQRIINNVADIDVSVSGVSAAIEEQNATTAEITRSIADASQGAQQVSQVISDVLRGAQETGDSADNLLQASREVSQLSEQLKVSVDSFLIRVRTDNSV